MWRLNVGCLPWACVHTCAYKAFYTFCYAALELKLKLNHISWTHLLPVTKQAACWELLWCMHWRRAGYGAPLHQTLKQTINNRINPSLRLRARTEAVTWNATIGLLRLEGSVLSLFSSFCLFSVLVVFLKRGKTVLEVIASLLAHPVISPSFVHSILLFAPYFEWKARKSGCCHGSGVLNSRCCKVPGVNNFSPIGGTLELFFESGTVTRCVNVCRYAKVCHFDRQTIYVPISAGFQPRGKGLTVSNEHSTLVGRSFCFLKKQLQGLPGSKERAL